LNELGKTADVNADNYALVAAVLCALFSVPGGFAQSLSRIAALNPRVDKGCSHSYLFSHQFVGSWPAD
jgi:hypothetical protein